VADPDTIRLAIPPDKEIFDALHVYLNKKPRQLRRCVVRSTRDPNKILQRRLVLTEFFYLRENLKNLYTWERYRCLWCDALRDAMRKIMSRGVDTITY
jgi:hypothetical protein